MPSLKQMLALQQEELSTMKNATEVVGTPHRKTNMHPPPPSSAYAKPRPPPSTIQTHRPRPRHIVDDLNPFALLATPGSPRQKRMSPRLGTNQHQHQQVEAVRPTPEPSTMRLLLNITTTTKNPQNSLRRMLLNEFQIEEDCDNHPADTAVALLPTTTTDDENKLSTEYSDLPNTDRERGGSLHRRILGVYNQGRVTGYPKALEDIVESLLANQLCRHQPKEVGNCNDNNNGSNDNNAEQQQQQQQGTIGGTSSGGGTTAIASTNDKQSNSKLPPTNSRNHTTASQQQQQRNTATPKGSPPISNSTVVVGGPPPLHQSNTNHERHGGGGQQQQQEEQEVVDELTFNIICQMLKMVTSTQELTQDRKTDAVTTCIKLLCICCSLEDNIMQDPLKPFGNILVQAPFNPSGANLLKSCFFTSDTFQSLVCSVITHPPLHTHTFACALNYWLALLSWLAMLGTEEGDIFANCLGTLLKFPKHMVTANWYNCFVTIVERRGADDFPIERFLYPSQLFNVFHFMFVDCNPNVDDDGITLALCCTAKLVLINNSTVRHDTVSTIVKSEAFRGVVRRMLLRWQFTSDTTVHVSALVRLFIDQNGPNFPLWESECDAVQVIHGIVFQLETQLLHFDESLCHLLVMVLHICNTSNDTLIKYTLQSTCLPSLLTGVFARVHVSVKNARMFYSSMKSVVTLLRAATTHKLLANWTVEQRFFLHIGKMVYLWLHAGTYHEYYSLLKGAVVWGLDALLDFCFTLPNNEGVTLITTDTARGILLPIVELLYGLQCELFAAPAAAPIVAPKKHRKLRETESVANSSSSAPTEKDTTVTPTNKKYLINSIHHAVVVSCVIATLTETPEDALPLLSQYLPDHSHFMDFYLTLLRNFFEMDDDDTVDFLLRALCKFFFAYIAYIEIVSNEIDTQALFQLVINICKKYPNKNSILMNTIRFVINPFLTFSLHHYRDIQLLYKCGVVDFIEEYVLQQQTINNSPTGGIGSELGAYIVYCLYYFVCQIGPKVLLGRKRNIIIPWLERTKADPSFHEGAISLVYPVLFACQADLIC